jgi:protein-S-isoprenylcysteine O-methyltransferase Ste14
LRLYGFFFPEGGPGGKLLPKVDTTAYILIAIQTEEPDLVSIHSETYEDYRRQVSMLLPLPPRK